METQVGLDLLKKHFGYDAFREGQAEVIGALLAGRDAVAIMPTGGGKSVCYQLPALRMPGVAVVVSPLISLMADQVRSLREAGIPAAFLNSSLDAGAFGETVRAAAAGAYRLLYVAPERLDTAPFLELAKSLDVSLVAVDEAHCISQWGQNFRPSYLKIADFIAQMPRRPAVSAFTATATLRVREDIIRALGLKDPLIVISGFNRPNLYFEVRKPQSKERELLSLLKKEGAGGRSGIVYCATRKTVEAVHGALLKKGVAAVRYHAGLLDAERHGNQEDFLYDRAQVMVATNAFGMGIDKPDVRWVVHYNMPKSVEAYYQEAGRAGRDGAPAACYLFYSAADWQTQRFLIERGAEENAELSAAERDAVLEKDMRLLRDMAYYAKTEACLRRYILSYFGERGDARCDNCGNCCLSFEETDATAWARAALNCVHQICARGWPFGKTMVADVLAGAGNEKVRRAGLAGLKTFGLLSELPQRKIIDLLDAMEQDGLIEVSADRYPVVTIGGEAGRAKEAGFRYVVRVPKREEKSERAEAGAKRPKGRGAAAGAGTASREGAPYSEELFELLRTLRRELAEEADIPAFVVFPDAALIDMCRVLPQNEEEFLSVAGVGQAKCARYGPAFLEKIQEWSKKK
ncbi:MAG: DNA helicase RecQ [Clostridiales Family XIII bacterium]|nr:DNA helicase RecQ [Clostridiales Family XIII bacterium]